MRRKGKSIASKSARDGSGFIALPWVVVDSPAFKNLSHPAKALLIEIARQWCRDNNGKLLCSRAYLKPRGWGSNAVIARAKKELLEAGFIYETVKGQRPNKASWYALTWYMLDNHSNYDYGAKAGFVRGAYLKNQSLVPSAGAKGSCITPSSGTGSELVAPPNGAMRRRFRHSSVPPDGHHLEVTISEEGGRCIKEERKHRSRGYVGQLHRQVVTDLLASGRSCLSGVVLNYRQTIARPFNYKTSARNRPSMMATR